MRKIPLTCGYEALVSDSDYDQVIHLKWSVVPAGSSPVGCAILDIQNRIVYVLNLACACTGNGETAQ